MGRFDNKTVIVTGGALGMGASHARGFVEEGARVVIGDVLEEEGKAAADELGDRAIFVRLDVASEEDWAAAVAAAEDAFGPVSVLINNAGIPTGSGHAELIEDTDVASWRRVIDVNLTGPFLGIRAVVPSMRKAGGGVIVNVGSALAMKCAPGLGSYVASKWGLRGLSKAAAVELGRYNIRVNSIHPAAVRTRLSAGPEAKALVEASKTWAIPRIAEPEEITRLALFVASDEASYSTGGEFVADGGELLGPAVQ
ncbi:3alpha(or 20beta)-hydroxysteroid dehydrogenase [Kribbella orskensis]|uniref:3alpha(Or 20beta)-hydroxysteroid dehydrogenase n=1 Tax=Kribbella orskensis TaxID=2512216 RepID=A0ABY2BVM1_9ACTN|nr:MULTISPECIES: glucose 1-dehydrogenase [Kribbella]TCN44180.1 3alpha(or 20beta)-hydroxysteroid dehydrogenase [Kribbella sp. VKM Ac-2500]TCO32042.1 3alpha(or 20beta)-hydroxysteroid dehydrogenase [Kribbella orskensis]